MLCVCKHLEIWGNERHIANCHSTIKAFFFRVIICKDGGVLANNVAALVTNQLIVD